jgi:beta-barrel assembly-enhancing protease
VIRPARLAWPLLAAAALASTPAAAQFGALNDLVNKAQSAQKIGEGLRKINEAEEIKIGGDLAGMLLGAAPLVEDPAKQAYVNRLGRWLALHSGRPNLPWKFCIVDSDDFNAFSTPGGYVLITRGLFERMRSEAELAGVLAHEIAHVERKHHLEALQRSLRDQSLTEMRRYFTVSTGNSIADQFSTALLNAGKDLYIKGLDPNAEYEADRIGVTIAARSGYSAYGLGGVLQTLTATTDEKAYGMHTRTHPSPLDRLSRLDAAMGARFEAIGGLVEDTPGYLALRRPPPPPAPAAPKPKPAKKKRP